MTITHDALPSTWPPSRSTVHSGDHRISYTDVGDGPTILLVHTGMWSFVWRDVVERLRDDHRCITLDAPGTGATGGDSRVSIEDAADAIDAVVRHLDLQAITLVFHDLGGPSALEAAARWPERVVRVAAINSFGWQPSGAAFRGMLRLMGSGPMRGLDAATGFLPAMSSTSFGVGRHLDKAERKEFRAGIDRGGRRAFHRYLRAALDHDYATIERAVSVLANRPMLTIFGEKNDPLGFQPQWAERFADIRQVLVEGGNHFPMCDDPALVARELAAFVGPA